MAVEITVGPPRITINQGNTFLVTQPDGRIEPTAELGLFSRDTRFVSSFELRIDDLAWLPVNSSEIAYDSARLFYVSPDLETPWGPIGMREIGLRLDRRISNTLEDHYEITNYTLHDVRFHLVISLACDFADIFEVKAHTPHLRGDVDSSWNFGRRELLFEYRDRDFQRCTRFCIAESSSPPHYANGKIVFDVQLAAGRSWRARTTLAPVIGGPAFAPGDRESQVGSGTAGSQGLQRQWQESVTHVSTPVVHVRRAFAQSVADMGALRLYEHDVNETTWVPAAGIPWFVTLFGRDSLIASLQTMPVSSRFAVGAIRTLAKYQADARDDWRDMQPGKIVHELRHGELAHFKLIPQTPYYGTADATILFLIVLSEAWRWTGDTRLLAEFRDHAIRALEWIDRYGDLDGDGFQEYKTFSSQGYHNQGWKDAGDALVYPDGSQVQQPIAVCELQGYVFDAKNRMAEVFDVLGDHARAGRLRDEAARLQARFDEAFWMKDEQFYAYALDPAKKQVKSSASNAGQLLWSGIVPGRRAAAVVARLLQPDMYSGWGVRTLTSRNPAFNPYAYQLGSVWPHDNGIIALGAKRYGHWEATNTIAKGIFDAAAVFRGFRLPELFAGLEREDDSFPAQYLGANIPQAWAAGSVFMLLRAILGLEADAPHKALRVRPTLPDWLPEITVSNLQVGAARVALRFSGQGTSSRWEMVDKQGEVTVS